MGSSMMPQKKNPGTLELLRGRTGIINGYMVAGHTMLHGLPSGYNRDFHEEKELLFASLRVRSNINSDTKKKNFTRRFVEQQATKDFII